MRFPRRGMPALALLVAGCGHSPEPLGAKAPAFVPSADPKAFASFVVGRWKKSMYYSTARTRLGHMSEALTEGSDQLLDLRADGTAEATIAFGPSHDHLSGRWKVDGERVLLDFPRSIPENAQPSRWDQRARRLKLVESLVASFGPLVLDPDGRRLQDAKVVRREDGSTFMGTPMWLRLGKA